MKFLSLFENETPLVEARRCERTRVEVYHECPHCNKEIGEKEIFVPDMNARTPEGYMIEVHRACGGRIWGPRRTPEEETRFQEFKKQWGLSEASR